MPINQFSRTENQFDGVIFTLEELIRRKGALTRVRKLEEMLADLKDIRRSMQKLNKTVPKGRSKFWKLSRRSVSLAVKIASGLSSS